MCVSKCECVVPGARYVIAATLLFVRRTIFGTKDSCGCLEMLRDMVVILGYGLARLVDG